MRRKRVHSTSNVARQQLGVETHSVPSGFLSLVVALEAGGCA